MTGNAIMSRRRAAFCMGLLALMLVLLVGRLIQINTSMAPKLLGLAARQRTSEMIIPARRGSIYDRRGRVLAGSEMRPSLYADPSLIDDPAETARKIGEIIRVDPGMIENEIRVSSAPRFCWLERRIDPAEADAVMRLNLPGIGSVDEFARYWPMESLAGHVLGFVGYDQQGLAGVELVRDQHLAAKGGRFGVIRDARRHALQSWGAFESPVDGSHVVLTIDAVIQEITEHQLAETIERFDAESGVAIVMAPRTGEILAMVCSPEFEPARAGDVDEDVRRNRTVTDPIEPGSVFKPFIMASAMAGGYVSLGEQFNVHNGVYMFGGRTIHDTSPQDKLTPKGILIYSSNIGMGQIGQRMGNQKLDECVRAFGFGELTQLGLPGESRGVMRDLRKWDSYSTTSVPMGQELAVTPIQMVTAFSALINDGVLLRPRIIKAHLDTRGEIIEAFDEPEVVRRAIPANVARKLTRDMLPAVVARHSPTLDPTPYDMLGKTGTAQVPFFDRPGYEPGAYVSSFIGAGPVDDPQVAVLVMIHKPDPILGYYGSKVAGPAGRDIIRAVLEYLRVPAPPQVAANDSN